MVIFSAIAAWYLHVALLRAGRPFLDEAVVRRRRFERLQPVEAVCKQIRSSAEHTVAIAAAWRRGSCVRKRGGTMASSP